ncbi:hypothetical protein [Paraflavitalea speifideaquila]|uniref:hypothetical protein n=1 Tax=Paraflavitalea speifideaquila TaxID=3076558 RepID=UPI0028E74E65|nr:hypothetical protein [Paraflavitalea speifideiaquila]
MIVTLLYIIHEYLIVRFALPAKTKDWTSTSYLIYYGTSLLFFSLFAWLIVKVEKREMQKLPFIGKYFN